MLITLSINFLLSHSSKGSLVRPKVVRSVHYCPATKKTMERKYTDMTSLDAFPSSAIYPTKVRTHRQVCRLYVALLKEVMRFSWTCSLPHPTGRGEQPPGDRVRSVNLQGPPDHHSAGDAGEGPCWPAASLCGHHPGQRPGGHGQTRRQGADCWNVPLPAWQEGRIHLGHVQVRWNNMSVGACLPFFMIHI